jgi:hypothetical protein
MLGHRRLEHMRWQMVDAPGVVAGTHLALAGPSASWSPARIQIIPHDILNIAVARQRLMSVQAHTHQGQKGEMSSSRVFPALEKGEEACHMPKCLTFPAHHGIWVVPSPPRGPWDQKIYHCDTIVTIFLPRNKMTRARFQTADTRYHAANHHNIRWFWVWHPKTAVVCACPSIRSAASENIRIFASCGRGAPCRFLLGGLSVLHLSTSNGSLQHAAHAPIVVSVRRTFSAPIGLMRA